jgi:hypothetical protein
LVHHTAPSPGAPEIGSGVASERSKPMTSQKSTAVRTERIRLLNDLMRQGGTGGRIMITAGVSALGREFVAQAMTYQFIDAPPTELAAAMG